MGLGDAPPLTVPLPFSTPAPQDLKKAKGHVGGIVYGFVSLLLLTPCLGFALREIPLNPQLFSIGRRAESVAEV